MLNTGTIDTSGKVWTCKACGRGFSRIENFEEHDKDRVNHIPLFQVWLKNKRSFGRCLDRMKKPWGCPRNAEQENVVSVSVQSHLQLAVPDVSAVSQQEPALSSSRYVNA